MREKFFGALLGAGVLLLLLTAAASDMGTLAFGSVAVRVLLAGLLIAVGLWGRGAKAKALFMRARRISRRTEPCARTAAHYSA